MPLPQINFIRRRATALGKYQHEIARELGVHETTLVRVAHGRHRLRDEDLARLAGILKVSVPELRAGLTQDARALNVLHGVSSLEYSVRCDRRPLHEIFAAVGIDYDIIVARGRGLTHAELMAVADELHVDRAAVEANLEEQQGGF